LESTGELARVGLRFRAGPVAHQLPALFTALAAWDRKLTPATAYRIRGPESPAPARWSEELAAQLAQGCAAGAPVDWTIVPKGGAANYHVRYRFSQILFDLDFRWRGGSLSAHARALLERLPPPLWPAMLYCIDVVGDEEMTLDGLHVLMSMPPVLYLDGPAAGRLGWERLRSAPCDVSELGGGVLLTVEDDLRASTRPEARTRRAAVFRHLGLSEGAAIEPERASR
jgi:hypothetical protein